MQTKLPWGEALFNEVKLSVNNTVGCAHCHNLNTAGMDGLSHSFGVNGEITNVNAPTAFASALGVDFLTSSFKTRIS